MIDDDDREIEELLAAYAPAPPPPELRDRIVAATRPASNAPRWWALAAGLVLAGLLQAEAARIDTRAAAPAVDSGAEAAREIVAFLGLPAQAQEYVSRRLTTPAPTPSADLDEAL